MEPTEPPSRVPSPTARAIRQVRPFRNSSHEAVVGLALTADTLDCSFGALLAPHGITPAQFNVLRILRGAGPKGLPTLEIAARMVVKTPGITRLLDRLEKKRFVARRRPAEDRRQVVCVVTKPGLELLARLDEPVATWDDDALATLTERERRTLIDLLDRVRAARD